jgi:ABC-type nitrate/sulfonate/bicarbonate transport system substrate-binding protein
MPKTAPTHLRICTFKGLQNLPLYVARQQGFFDAHGLDIEIIYTAGSRPQVAGLASGEYDLIQTAPDNVVNVDNNPVSFGLDPTTAPRIVMVFGGSTGPLSLYAQPGITTFNHLRGTVLGVDNPTSGFALVLQDMLARNGMMLGQDYTFTVAGGTSARLDALKTGSVAATILYAPFDSMALEEGYSRLASSNEYYVAYASLSTASTQDWLATNGRIVTRYITALRQALHWIYDPVHIAAVQSILEGETLLELDANLATRAYTAFVDPITGFGIDGLLDPIGLQQVIDIRATYGLQPQLLNTPATYLDLRWYQLATKEMYRSFLQQSPDRCSL